MDALEKDLEKFEVIKKTKLEDLVTGVEKTIPTSDLSIQTDTHIIQLRLKDTDNAKDSVKIKTGVYSIEKGMKGIELKPFKLKKYDLLESILNTKIIQNEASLFFSKLDKYKQLKKEPKRAILLCSVPGVGKTASINQVCQNFLKDNDVSVIVWDTSAIEASVVNKLFLKLAHFDKKVKKMIFVIEDIQGGSTEDDYGSRGVSTSLLNLLDGIGDPFKGIPTFIISTTNNPEREVGALIDRPGRFDKVIELKTPSLEETEALLKFISKKQELSKEDIEAVKLASKNEFSIAHLQEVVIRSVLDDITFLEATKQLVAHKERFKNAFQKTKKIGFNT